MRIVSLSFAFFAQMNNLDNLKQLDLVLSLDYALAYLQIAVFLSLRMSHHISEQRIPSKINLQD